MLGDIGLAGDATCNSPDIQAAFSERPITSSTTISSKRSAPGRDSGRIQGSAAQKNGVGASIACQAYLTALRTEGMNSRVHPKYETNYRVGNWAEYDRALVRRGDVTLWLAAETTDDWKRDC
jgi:hypothetical protein